MQHYQINHGFIELIIGCMFAGKTEELIRRVSVLIRGKKKVLVFKPLFDKRYETNYVQSHSGAKIFAHLVQTPQDIEKIIFAQKRKIDVLAFDEIQFLKPEFTTYLEKKANQGYHIICAGLDKGYNDELFTTVMRLTAQAEFVTKLMAVCVICGNMATKTQRINQDKKPIGPNEVSDVVGGDDVYQARCRKCFVYFPVLG